METIWNNLKEKRILCGFILLAILTTTFFTLYVMEVTAEEAYTCPKTIEYEEKEEEEEIYTVDVKGAVANPGVYRMKKGSIIQDVLTVSGGITKEADTSNLNLSKKVSNEMVITVFTSDEIKKMKLEKEPIEENKNETNTEGKETTLISLNTATEEELATLPGIGEAKAKIIIAYREKCGKFKKKEELKNIKGIGEKIYEKLESYITV